MHICRPSRRTRGPLGNYLSYPRRGVEGHEDELGSAEGKSVLVRVSDFWPKLPGK